MSQSRDLYLDAYGNYRPITATSQGYAQQAQHYPVASQDYLQMHPNTSQMQQNATDTHNYPAQERRPVTAYSDAPGYSRTVSSYGVYQGSRPGTQQYEEYVDSRVSLAGYQHQPDDSRQRTASFVQYRQQNHTGARYPSSAVEAERRGIGYAASSITSFDNQFSRTADIDANSLMVRRGDSPSAYAHRSNINYASYPSYIEYPSQRDSSSRGRGRGRESA
ncbi:hypothetical protein NW762_004509 [Fusarium torreyae]|uniref:Uncharacterized protein n=1 Tax=Fusarium torreyae TaxID=1237075 RepID=A0A9W8S9I3_9HYPO|nr:hypothetical protein NW762_004509 [Fusarium torreyae]